jgi:hypothetical protein
MPGRRTIPDAVNARGRAGARVSGSKGLYGRAAEEAAIAAVLKGARAGCGGVLVLRGEAGIGKTALLDGTARSAADMTVLRATAIETEAELPFAALHLLLRPVLGELAGLPGPRARALERVLGLAAWPAQPPDDVFLAGLPELHLGPLGQEAARELLAAQARDLDPLLADRVLGDAGQSVTTSTRPIRSWASRHGRSAGRLRQGNPG